MSEKRFSNLEIVKNLIMLDDNDKFIVFTEKTLCNLLNELNDENEQLRQILKDIVSVTDETYTKDKNIYKITVVFDSEKYLKIRECLT